MRLTSEFFVAALIRRAYAAGCPAMVVRRGAAEAGAVFVTVDRLDGTADLYGPAPQTAFGADASERLFLRGKEKAMPPDIEAALERERRFDPDIWVVAIEDRQARPFLELAKS
jgi:hypothetical protein